RRGGPRRLSRARQRAGRRPAGAGAEDRHQPADRRAVAPGAHQSGRRALRDLREARGRRGQPVAHRDRRPARPTAAGNPGARLSQRPAPRRGDRHPDVAMTADGLPPLREVIAKYDLAARRALGQNFLLDLNLTAKIARAAGDITAGTTIEIGPGPGGLTRALLSHGVRELIAIERDARCLGALAEIAAAYPGKLTVIEGDALTVDCAKLGSAPRRIVANLPYNIATPLIIKWLQQGAAFTSLTVMVQKEVA